MKKTFVLLCLLLAYLGGDAQQKANYKLAEKFTQMGLSGIAAGIVCRWYRIIFMVGRSFGLSLERMRGRCIIWLIR